MRLVGVIDDMRDEGSMQTLQLSYPIIHGITSLGSRLFYGDNTK